VVLVPSSGVGRNRTGANGALEALLLLDPDCREEAVDTALLCRCCDCRS
jgi:hypothetical protein